MSIAVQVTQTKILNIVCSFIFSGNLKFIRAGKVHNQSSSIPMSYMRLNAVHKLKSAL